MMQRVRPRVWVSRALLHAPIPGLAWLAMSDASHTGCGCLVACLYNPQWTIWSSSLDLELDTLPLQSLPEEPPVILQASRSMQSLAPEQHYHPVGSHMWFHILMCQATVKACVLRSLLRNLWMLSVPELHVIRQRLATLQCIFNCQGARGIDHHH